MKFLPCCTNINVSPSIAKPVLDDVSSVDDVMKKRIDAIQARVEAILKNNYIERKDDLPVIPPPKHVTHFPTSEQTNGIHPFFVRLCAQISNDNYSKLSSESAFDNLSKGYDLKDPNVPINKYPSVELYDNHKIFEATNPPFVVVLAGTKLILCWRGSQTIMDWVRDFSFYPAGSFRWMNVAKVVKVHGGYLSMVENSLSVHEGRLLEIIEKNEITEILLTGHSLGGGVAQVAQVWFQGTMDKDIDPRPNPWRTLAETKGLTVRCLSFEGPTTTVFVKSNDDSALNEKGLDFINKCGSLMCTTVFSMDPVPRVPGNTDFLLRSIEDLLTDLEKGWFSGLKKAVIDLILNVIRAKLSPIEQIYFPIAQQFQHIGKCLYYDSPEAVPKVYIDNDQKNLANPQNLPNLSTIPFVESEGPFIETVLYNHGFIVGGPGLAFVQIADNGMGPIFSRQDTCDA